MDSQETLRLLGRDKQTFAEWLGDQPAEFIAAYSKPVKDFSAVWLAGPRGCGKTHLLHAAAHAQNGFGRRVLVVRAAQDAAERQCQLEGLEASDIELLALDDAQRWIGDANSEARLLVLYEELQRGNGVLLLAAQQAPAELTFALPDCASRYRSAAQLALSPLLEDACRRLLKRQARRRGLPLAKPVLDFWLKRRPRDAKTLMADFERLDQAVWQRKERLTINLIKSVLGI